jgi:hypothetical protein
MRKCLLFGAIFTNRFLVFFHPQLRQLVFKERVFKSFELSVIQIWRLP